MAFRGKKSYPPIDCLKLGPENPPSKKLRRIELWKNRGAVSGKTRRKKTHSVPPPLRTQKYPRTRGCWERISGYTPYYEIDVYIYMYPARLSHDRQQRESLRERKRERER